MKTFYLTPGEGLFIPSHRDPTRGIAPEGEPVPDTSFYRRYVARGEAIRTAGSGGAGTKAGIGRDTNDDGETKAPKGRETVGRDATAQKE